MLEYISPKWLPPLYKKLTLIRDERKNELANISDTFGDPLELAKFYIEPKCSHINPANIDEDEPISHINAQISETINPFLNGEHAVKGDGRTQMFVLSDAGMGKTSFLMMMKLSDLTSFWPKKYKCVIAKIGKNTVSFIQDITNKQNTILLLDALDEDSDAWGNYRERVLELLQATTKFRRVIITCRTQFFPNEEIDPFKRIGRIKIANFVCPMIYLSLFDDTQVNEYLEKRFCKNNEKIIKAKKIINSMGSLRFRPLLLAHIDGFLDSEIASWSEYQILKVLIDTWLMREEGKLYEQGRAISHSLLLKACVTVAAIMQKGRSREISETELEKLVNIYPFLKPLEFIEFGGRSLLNRTCDGGYRFSHYAIQEFINAYGLIDNLIIDSLEPLPYTDNLLSLVLNGSGNQFDLSRIDFSNVEFQGMNFNEIDFSRAKFTSAKLSHATFNNCKLKNCDFSKVYFSKSKNEFVYEKLDFSGCNFTGSFLEQTHFKNCTFVSCMFKNADLSQSAFIQCNFDGADFTSANLSSSNMSYSTFGDSIFLDANVSKTIFDLSKLKLSDISKASNPEESIIMSKY
jgi:uncharacterized protein YjbI with pentapeptide repeats